MTRVLAAVLVALTLSPAASAAAPKRADLGQIARGLVRAGAPGAIVYVRTPTATRAGTAGWADRAAHVSMRAADRYRIASVTKAFVSVVILQLEAEGKVDIDDSVEKYAPGLVPKGAGISLRALLNHTSGLFDYAADRDFGEAILGDPARVWTPRDVLAYAFAHPPDFAPGTNWGYSNTNYILLGLVAEAVTGEPLGQTLQKRIFTPLELTSTSFPLTIELAPDFVHGYFKLSSDTPFVDAAPLLGPSWGWAAGGIVSNAHDETLFYRGLLTGKLLPAAQLDEMETTSPLAGSYGLGIEKLLTKCGRAYGHEGDFIAWRNEVLATANGKRQAVVMVNVDQTSVSWRRMYADAQTALCRG
ncbi:MAG: serine hydrolase domain-containing protein [Gaiellaceae bacterium]